LASLLGDAELVSFYYVKFNNHGNNSFSAECLEVFLIYKNVHHAYMYMYTIIGIHVYILYIYTCTQTRYMYTTFLQIYVLSYDFNVNNIVLDFVSNCHKTSVQNVV